MSLLSEGNHQYHSQHSNWWNFGEIFTTSTFNFQTTQLDLSLPFWPNEAKRSKKSNSILELCLKTLVKLAQQCVAPNPASQPGKSEGSPETGSLFITSSQTNKMSLLRMSWLAYLPYITTLVNSFKTDSIQAKLTTLQELGGRGPSPDYESFSYCV